MNIPRWFILSVGTVILAIWVAAFVATIFVPGYKADPIIGYAAMAVVAACFGSDAARMVRDKVKRIVENEARPNEQLPNGNNPGGNGGSGGAKRTP